MLGSILILRPFNLLLKKDICNRSQRKCPVGSRGLSAMEVFPDSGRGKGSVVGESGTQTVRCYPSQSWPGEVLPSLLPFPGEEIFILKFIFSEGTKEITERRSEDCFFNF